MSDVRIPQSGEPAATRAASWSWVWALVVLTVALTFVVGPFAFVLLGFGLLAGGLWVRHETPAQRDRALAGGLAAAGAAVLVVTAAVIAILLPVSSDPPAVPDPVEDVQTVADP